MRGSVLFSKFYDFGHFSGDRIYCFGGYCTGDNYKMKTPIDLFILNPHTYRWKEVPKPRTDSAEAEDWPYQRYGHTVNSVSCTFPLSLSNKVRTE